MLKHCGKSDKITEINYQRHDVLYYCQLSKNKEKKSIYYATKRETLLSG